MAPKIKLPKPPLPPSFQPKPPPPGSTQQGSPVETAKEAGISAVDWIDERTSLSGGMRLLKFFKIPKGTNLFYTLV